MLHLEVNPKSFCLTVGVYFMRKKRFYQRLKCIFIIGIR